MHFESSTEFAHRHESSTEFALRQTMRYIVELISHELSGSNASLIETHSHEGCVAQKNSRRNRTTASENAAQFDSGSTSVPFVPSSGAAVASGVGSGGTYTYPWSLQM